MTPRVSISVPNLNTRPYLPERFKTILDQTLRDWELLVYDSYSDDGAWEYICDVAAHEPRMRAWQGPREGTPGSWNPCIRQARGEYVYIATSDDTMPPDCLEQLVAALDAHPECDVAHCRLRPIDHEGKDVSRVSAWWSGSLFAQSSGSLLRSVHVRAAPFDGLLHLQGGSVYVSITQLLVRRSLFDRIGYFEATWGSVGDFNWAMRAGLVANTVHVPTTWGGWRLHPEQATAGAGFDSIEHARRIDRMIDDAIETTASLVDPVIGDCLARRWSPQAKALRSFSREVMQRRDSFIRRRCFLLAQVLAGSRPAREYLKSRLTRSSFPDRVRSWLTEAGHEGPFLVPSADSPVSQ